MLSYWPAATFGRRFFFNLEKFEHSFAGDVSPLFFFSQWNLFPLRARARRARACSNLLNLQLRGEAAATEAYELNHLHQPEIALAHANVVNCDMAATALHNAVTAEITTQRAELKAADATDLRIEAALQPQRRATPPESEPEEATDSSDNESSSEEENS